MNNFNVGDKVLAYGSLGIVMRILPEQELPLEVAFYEQKFCQNFTLDGKTDSRHLGTALTLIIPAKKIVEKKLYVAVITNPEAASSRGGHYCSLAYPERIHAEGQFSSPHQVCEVVINVEE